MTDLKEKIERLLPHVQKPGRYSGGELNSVVKDPDKVNVRFAFCFPDVYEIGMSHLGMKILYSLENAVEDVWCERVFAPWPDMEKQMRDNGIPLFGLESRQPITDFDFIGFTLQYELSFTNILNMLDLAGIPIHSCERRELKQMVVMGGPCACNPEPLADFADIFILGEGEEVNLELIELYKKHKSAGSAKEDFLKEAARIKGIYVPAFYEPSYNDDGTINNVTVKCGAPEKITKRIIADMDKAYYPEKFVVPFIDIVHDRAMEEIFRGCIRGCRFCQAGFIYRPVREKSSDTILKQSKSLCKTTGYDEVSLTSLSTSDYTKLTELLPELLTWSEQNTISVALPSLRIDNFSDELLEQMKLVRKSGLTFAPEAGTQRLRDVINKNLNEEEILSTCMTAFRGGYTNVKLYFMMGLPTETDEDILGIAQLGQKIVNLFYSNPDKPKGKGVTVTCSVAMFVPKPFTPFQWEPQDTIENIRRKQKLLVDSVTTRKITVNWHDSYIRGFWRVFWRAETGGCAR